MAEERMVRYGGTWAALRLGADVRFVQEMLGHAKLDTTQIYTHVSIQKLKAIHTATHPGTRLERKPRGEEAEDTGPK